MTTYGPAAAASTGALHDRPRARRVPVIHLRGELAHLRDKLRVRKRALLKIKHLVVLSWHEGGPRRHHSGHETAETASERRAIPAASGHHGSAHGSHTTPAIVLMRLGCGLHRQKRRRLDNRPIRCTSNCNPSRQAFTHSVPRHIGSAFGSWPISSSQLLVLRRLVGRGGLWEPVLCDFGGCDCGGHLKVG